MEDELRSHLLHLAATYSDATGVSPATIGKRAINDNTFFQRLEAEAGFTVKTFDRVVGWLSDNWPECVVWPSVIPRPRVRAHEGDAA